VADLLKFHVRPVLRDATLVLAFEGWNDAGSAASEAVRFVQDHARAVPLAEIDCQDFLDFTVARPTVRFGDGDRRIVEWPDTRFAYGAIDPSREIVTGLGAEPHLRWRSYADACVELAQVLGLARIVLLGAYLAEVVYSRPVAVTGFASDPQLLESIGVPGSGYEGPTGIVGILGDRFQNAGFELLSLWAGLPHYISASPNPRGTLALVQKVMALLDLKLETDGLEKEAARFEEKVSELVADDPELGEYVRQLKRREFAQ
jgi:hypothetical protein